MEIKVTYLDGREALAKIIPFDTVQLERKWDITIDELEKSGKVEHVLFMAYVSLKRVGLTGEQDFDAWAATVEDVDDGEEDEEEDDSGEAAAAADAAPGPGSEPSPALSD